MITHVSTENEWPCCKQIVIKNIKSRVYPSNVKVAIQQRLQKLKKEQDRLFTAILQSKMAIYSLFTLNSVKLSLHLFSENFFWSNWPSLYFLCYRFLLGFPSWLLFVYFKVYKLFWHLSVDQWRPFWTVWPSIYPFVLAFLAWFPSWQTSLIWIQLVFMLVKWCWYWNIKWRADVVLISVFFIIIITEW